MHRVVSTVIVDCFLNVLYAKFTAPILLFEKQVSLMCYWPEERLVPSKTHFNFRKWKMLF